ncbi:MAG: quinolinate synthase [Planctomycetes bacterium GWF2_50_10]|nr:MAG: quinolinate synthase [Planctomycetes bacterium GWF2_50_10]
MNPSLVEKIAKLKRQRNAVILAHNYQIGEVQDIADFTGDSLGLSIQAAKTKADVIVFCGVHFMAETAAILSPSKTVLLPDSHAGCPMADMITAPQLIEFKAKYPGAVVVCYVNSSAEVKAHCDVCCTSANAVEIIKSIDPAKQIIFVPDKYLGSYAAAKTGRDIILWPGYCPTHANITAEDITKLKIIHPDALVLAHPECRQEVVALADKALSTSGMIKFVAASPATEFIIATEQGIIHTLKKQNPQKHFIIASQRAVCPNMKRITLEKILWSLEDMKYKITVDPEIAAKALKSIEKMVSVLPS